jgi:DNA-binding FrmR family transcriptional regulator
MPVERCAVCDLATTSSLGNPGSDTPNEVKNDSTARMNRIVGQVSGVMRMIEDDRPCAEILNQIAAVRSALDQLGVRLLTGHLERRVLGVDEGCRYKLLDELRASLSQFLN